MLKLEFLGELRNRKNLLGFSGGSDSVALFYALIQNEVYFDIAIVDYGIRESSKDEVSYALDLAHQYQKKCFVFKAPQIASNFEAKAREIRYGFFERIIDLKGYENLVLAHQLNDRLEWFLMQLSKGCSLATLLGFDGIEIRENYRIIRPLINTPKKLIYAYCHSYKFFEDSSNQDMSYKRNEFRLKYTQELVEKYCTGIAKSFEYLREEKSFLYPNVAVLRLGEIRFFERGGSLSDIYQTDKILKTMGYVLSASQRQEIFKMDFSLEIGQKYIIESNEEYIFVSKSYSFPFAMPKKFKNIARILKIPRRIRPQIHFYLDSRGMKPEEMMAYLRKKLCKCE
ncbi:tRNA lysidine(34) synthetase TilS [Helicobacter sp. 12S02232-10]|uniref:tRNA lysidine(34) synthetase TilS n=1 Tax=Helicobacter sp. 12S02232-10 TaxID=1476197 RepID=UPI000BA5ED61|nr:tRNA lysidine(34) synthetase TilS [Helicobacter sp. 12S02232-10]PAF49551.1 tRNA lysidine(34) synthetase TilS [Helicobacter sp. 12S02232-10]